MTLDLSKPITTRDGRPVTLITTEGREPYSVIGYIGHEGYPRGWRTDGHCTPNKIPCDIDLINAPEPKRSGVGWVNFYPNKMGWGYATRDDADKASGDHRIARIRVPWTEGQFDMGETGK